VIGLRFAFDARMEYFQTEFEIMKHLRLLPLLLIACALAGCGTINSQDREVLKAHNVPPDVYDKMLYGDPLSLDDVIALSQREVPPGLIIHYMQEMDLVYYLRKPDVRELRSGGVDESVIAYMLSTAPQYGPGPYAGGYYGGAYPYPYYGPYPYGYYGGPVVVVGGYGRWGYGRGGWGGRGWYHHH
jgi:hypothetical protein